MVKQALHTDSSNGLKGKSSEWNKEQWVQVEVPNMILFLRYWKDSIGEFSHFPLMSRTKIFPSSLSEEANDVNVV